MTVFKGFLRGAVRQKAVILLYLCIFVGLGTLMTLSTQDNAGETFTSETLSAAVIDRDHSEISRGLAAFLGERLEIKPLQDKKELLKEELYYGNVQYVLVIPEGFQTGLLEEKDPASGLLEGTGRPGSVQTSFAKELVSSYLSGVGLYLSAGYAPEAAVERMGQQEQSRPEVALQKGSGAMRKTAATLQYLPYVLTALSCYIIGFVMLDYQKIDIRRRLAVSAVSALRRTAEMLLAVLVIGLAFFAVSILMVSLMHPAAVLKEPNKGYYLYNMAAMVLVGLSVGFFVVQVASSGNAVNGLANVIALGMSFICGVFIPNDLLSHSVKKLAEFLPVYWYEQNNSILGTHTVLSSAMKSRLYDGYGRQLLFAALLFAVAFLIHRVKHRKA